MRTETLWKEWHKRMQPDKPILPHNLLSKSLSPKSSPLVPNLSFTNPFYFNQCLYIDERVDVFCFYNFKVQGGPKKPTVGRVITSLLRGYTMASRRMYHPPILLPCHKWLFALWSGLIKKPWFPWFLAENCSPLFLEGRYVKEGIRWLAMIMTPVIWCHL